MTSDGCATGKSQALPSAFTPSRRHVCGGLLSAMVCCLPGVKAQADALAADAVEMTEIAPGVHIFRGVHEEASPANLGAIANTAVVLGRNAVAVVDTGGSFAWGRRLRRAIADLTALPVRHVINTHVHPDHIFGNAAFDGDAAEIWGHRKLPNALAARGQYYLDQLQSLLGAGAQGTRVVPPTQLVAESRAIDLGGRVLSLTAHPTAHTDNDLTVLDSATNTLFASDLLFMERLPAIDGSLNGWLSVIGVLRQVPADRVVPGHGPAAAPWPAAMDAQERYLRLLQSDVRRLIAAGVPMEKAVESAGRGEPGAWRLFEEYNPRNVVTAYAELEWE
jgi:quinoprotein relay system zinc metallohydrolase 2